MRSLEKMACHTTIVLRNFSQVGSFTRINVKAFAVLAMPALLRILLRTLCFEGLASKGILRLIRANKIIVDHLKRLACHTKPWRSMVEAMGIEPMSALPETQSDYMLSFRIYSSCTSKTVKTK